MNLLEQIAELKRLIANVNETLTHSAEMEEWELKEYKDIKDGYLEEMAELETHLPLYYLTFGK